MKVDKTCKYCGEMDLSKLAIMQGYILNKCRSCAAAKKKEWDILNKERVKGYKKVYREENSEEISAYNKIYREATTSKRLKVLKEWRSNNPDKVNKYSAKRRANIKRTLPALDGLLSELNTFIIEEAYSLSRLRTDLTGIEWHVDHIVPLNNPKVCGLHVGINLQVIPAKENLSKSNRFKV